MTNARYQRTRPVTNRTPPHEQPHYAVIKKDGWLCAPGPGANAILPGLKGFQLRQKRESEEETQKALSLSLSHTLLSHTHIPSLSASIALIELDHLEGAGSQTLSFTL